MKWSDLLNIDVEAPPNHKASAICFNTTKDFKQLADILHADIKIELEVVIKPRGHNDSITPDPQTPICSFIFQPLWAQRIGRLM